MEKLHVVLVEPEIPQNAGNVFRTCAATGAVFHLVRPLGFFTTDRRLRRAGLDYWDERAVAFHDGLEDFLADASGGSLAFFSRAASRSYTELAWPGGRDLFLVFGKESAGLPPGLLRREAGRCFRLPMTAAVRSINLASAAAVVVYDVLRRRGFPGLA
jgi:tRNA (cytidine/uridine-2'-O-)-methyltransferase